MEFTAEKIEKFKWPISVVQKVEASPKDIWSAITKPGNLKDFHPFCKENPVYKWPGDGAKDAVHYYSGWILNREFVNWIDGVGYGLLIGREGGRRNLMFPGGSRRKSWVKVSLRSRSIPMLCRRYL